MRQKMHRKYFHILVVGVITSLIASCGNDQDHMAGLWHGTCSDTPTQTYGGQPFSIEIKEDGKFSGLGGRYKSTTEGQVTLIDNEQIIFTASNGATRTGGYTLDAHHLRLMGLIDPHSTLPTPAWCTLTRTRS